MTGLKHAAQRGAWLCRHALRQALRQAPVNAPRQALRQAPVHAPRQALSQALMHAPRQATVHALRQVLGRALLPVLLATCALAPALAPAPQFSVVTPERPLSLPADYGAHPDFRTEWWYATGWLITPDGKPLGFQITFFRTATDHDRANPSRFAPQQLIIAHAALSDPARGSLQHDQKAAREGFGIAYAKTENTDVKLDDWTFARQPDGSYQARLAARDFTLALTLAPTQPPMLQGENGVSRKGPHEAQASYYYSEPHLKVSGTVLQNGKADKDGKNGQPGNGAHYSKPVAVTGSAWLDHEWSTSYLDPNASGWDWLGANLDDGSALMAFRIRDRSGGVLWSHANLRDASGKISQFDGDAVRFSTVRAWRSPHTGATYPVATQLRAGPLAWQLNPLQDDQELDSTQSTGAVYWEGAVSLTRDGRPVGRGYLELTGYVKPLKL